MKLNKGFELDRYVEVVHIMTALFCSKNNVIKFSIMAVTPNYIAII